MQPYTSTAKSGFAILFFLVSLILAVVPYIDRRNNVGCDFRYRYNEVLCARSGVDPYQVWVGNQTSDRFYSYNHPEWRSPTATLPVNAYPPWSYTFFYPWTLLPFDTAWRLYRAAEIAIVFGLACLGFRTGYRKHKSMIEGIFCSGAMLFLGHATVAIPATDNYGLFLTLALLFLIQGERIGNDWMEGLALSALMIKPQVGALFVVPLFIRRRWKACVIGGVICALASILPSIWLGIDPVSLVLQIPRYGSDVAHGSFLIPGPVFHMAERIVPQSMLVFINALAGLLTCILLTVRMRNSSSTIKFFIPAILCASLWTYSSIHDHWTWSVVQLSLALGVLKEKTLSRRVVPLLAMGLIGGTLLMLLHEKSTVSWVNTLHWNIIRGIGGKLLFLAYFGMTFGGIFLTFLWLWRDTASSSKSEDTNVP